MTLPNTPDIPEHEGIPTEAELAEMQHAHEHCDWLPCKHVLRLIAAVRALTPTRPSAAPAAEMDDTAVTRFEVIDHRKHANQLGRVYVVYNAKIERSYQDDGRTLKVFIGDRP